MDELTSLPQNALLQSRIEICRLLVALSRSHAKIAADVGSRHTFISHILYVDLREEHLIVSFCANKSLNAEILQHPCLRFAANLHDAHLVFELCSPIEVQFNEMPAIRYPLPAAMVLYHRRDCPRVTVPAHTSLRCIADEGGFMPFESRIIDISHDGFGAIQYEGCINIEPGTQLQACRIILPGKGSIVADLELRYTVTAPLADGSPAHRSGFRFLSKPEGLTGLVDIFTRDLDKQA